VSAVVLGFGNDFLGKIRYKIIDFVVICTIGTPDAAAVIVVEAEALCTRYERVQETLGLANILPGLQVVQVGRQCSLHRVWVSPGLPKMPALPPPDCD
jgi:hypothetical protein